MLDADYIRSCISVHFSCTINLLGLRLRLMLTTACLFINTKLRFAVAAWLTGGRDWSNLHFKLCRHERLLFAAGNVTILPLASTTLKIEERHRRPTQLISTRLGLACRSPSPRTAD